MLFPSISIFMIPILVLFVSMNESFVVKACAQSKFSLKILFQYYNVSVELICVSNITTMTFNNNCDHFRFLINGNRIPSMHYSTVSYSDRQSTTKNPAALSNWSYRIRAMHAPNGMLSSVTVIMRHIITMSITTYESCDDSKKEEHENNQYADRFSNSVHVYSSELYK